jgi:cytoskeleton protein RodZ
MSSFGENLRRERELRGVSLREISDDTKIAMRFLEALEDDRVDVLPGGLFPRSFVKQYASFVGLDPDRAVADFLAFHGQQLEPEGSPAPPTSAASRSWLSPGALFFAAVTLVAAFLVLRRPGEETERRAAEVARPAPVAATPTVLPTDRVYPPPATAPARDLARDTLVLTMTAEQSCWVEVRADGETVINRVLTEGESETLEARGEIVLSVGNAGGLALRVNDQPALPLGRNGEVRKNIVITRQSLPALVDTDGGASPDGQSG